MGQHKHNPVAIAAKNGEIPPKPRKPGKKEREAILRAEIMKAAFEVSPQFGQVAMLAEMIGGEFKGDFE